MKDPALKSMSTRVFLSALALLIAAPAAATEPPPEPEPAPAAQPATVQPSLTEAAEDPLKDVSITFSPLHLIGPFFELSAEFRVHDQIGISGILGMGSVTSGDVSAFMWDIGAQVRGYAVGDFDHGMQLGLEVLYIGADTEFEGSAVSANGLGIGPFVGYKVTADFGLAFEIQAGVAWVAVSAASETEEADASTILPLVNINLGWAF